MRLLSCFLLLISLPFALPAHGQSIDLNWSEDGMRCWYRQKSQDDTPRFRIIDINKRTCEPAFDEQQVAAALSTKRNRQADGKADGETDAAPARIIDIAFTKSARELLLRTKDGQWLLDLESHQLVATKAMDSAASTVLFLPPRGSTGGDEETEITVRNSTDQNLDLFWIAGNGDESTYGKLLAGQAKTQHTFVGHAWLLKSQDKTVGCFVATANLQLQIDNDLLANVARQTAKQQRNERQKRRDQQEKVNGRRSADEKPALWEAFVRDHELHLREPDGSEHALTTNASAENTFQRLASRRRLTEMEYQAEDGGDAVADLKKSPNGDHFVAFQTARVPERRVHYIESTPRDQLQPKLHSYPYAKPGDALPTKTLRLFSAKTKAEIPVSNALFNNPFQLRFLGWSETGDAFRLLYNERGHQVLRYLEVRCDNGHVRTVVEERSTTFIHYSDAGKLVREDLPGEELLWASERTNWNHLYRYDRSTGQLLNAVTSGEWNVKRIEHIDRDAKQIWFRAVGVYSDQDVYHEHLCRVQFDGSDFQVLTQADGTHKIQFERDHRYFQATYSRVDLAPITELRDSQSGALICELQRGDALAEFADRKLTERFVAKGRDGVTEIWGIIHWPRGFDPAKRYPVVENIYAGPHNHHVRKAFRSRYRHQHQIADAGMIVVQIDGMGTAWRSKEFHDVCHKNLRDAGFPDRIAWMRAAAAKYPQMDLSRVGIYGGSAGGQNAMAALLWHHDFYKVAVADCGCHDNRMDKIWWNEQWMGWPVDESYAESSNMENAHLMQGRLMLLLGELDRNVDPSSTRQVVRKLIEHDKEFEFVLVAGAGHGSAETPWGSKKRLNFLKQHLLTP